MNASQKRKKAARPKPGGIMAPGGALVGVEITALNQGAITAILKRGSSERQVQLAGDECTERPDAGKPPYFFLDRGQPLVILGVQLDQHIELAFNAPDAALQIGGHR
jgi:hypothetical protein